MKIKQIEEWKYIHMKAPACTDRKETYSLCMYYSCLKNSKGVKHNCHYNPHNEVGTAYTSKTPITGEVAHKGCEHFKATMRIL